MVRTTAWAKGVRKLVPLLVFLTLYAAFQDPLSLSLWRSAHHPARAQRKQVAIGLHLPQFYSAHGQDRWLLENLLDVYSPSESLKFVEAGTFDGLTGSNAATLEQFFGGIGLCYEPNPTMFKLVQQRRTCVAFNAMLCQTRDTGVELTFTEFAAPREQESGVISLMDDYKKNLVKQYEVRSEHRIQCRSLSNDIKTFFGGHLHLLSLDVEGAELDTLENLDWDEITIDIIIVERSHEQKVKACLVRHGFLHVALVGHDNVFVHEQSPAVSKYRDGCGCLLSGECQFAKMYPDAGWLNCGDSKPKQH